MLRAAAGGKPGPVPALFCPLPPAEGQSPCRVAAAAQGPLAAGVGGVSPGHGGSSTARPLCPNACLLAPSESLPEEQLASCGASDCLMATASSNSTQQPSQRLIYTLLGIYTGRRPPQPKGD